MPAQCVAWLRARHASKDYRVLDESELRTTRKSDTLFIFGSGASLNDLSPEDWETIAKHDTLGFNWFVRQRFVRCDYHLMREISSDDRRSEVWRRELAEYFELIRSNPAFSQTVFLVQEGLRATNGNRAIGYRLLPVGARVFRWRTRLMRTDLSTRLDEGLTHGYGTLGECVNFGYLLGWRRIVLAGVDLYDRRYFWLDADTVRLADEMRGAAASDRHATAIPEMLSLFGQWAAQLQEVGVDLLVQNPRSLLADILPVCEIGDLAGSPPRFG